MTVVLFTQKLSTHSLMPQIWKPPLKGPHNSHQSLDKHEKQERNSNY